MDAPIERRNVYELIAERLVEQIGEGRLKAGEAMPTERELAQRFGVGRSSVREALRMLESKGLIEAFGNGAYSVSTRLNPLHDSLGVLLLMREADLLELMEVRGILETGAAALAASHRDDEDLEEMRTALSKMTASLESREGYIQADLEFHLAIAGATGNRLAHHMMDALRGHLRQALGSIYDVVPDSPRKSISQHLAIYEAIAAGESELARERMQEHLDSVEHDVREAHPAAITSGPSRATEPEPA
jgi:GntR family transcriptional repressor for pyruvate dehydrogenase complex